MANTLTGTKMTSSETFHDCTLLAAEALVFLIQDREDTFTLDSVGQLYFRDNWVPSQVREILEHDAEKEMREFYSRVAMSAADCAENAA